MMNEFIKAVSDMRAAQKEYFAAAKVCAQYSDSITQSVKKEALAKSKKLEKIVDDMIGDFDSGQEKLF